MGQHFSTAPSWKVSQGGGCNVHGAPRSPSSGRRTSDGHSPMICFAFVITYPAKYSGTNCGTEVSVCWHKDDVKPLYIQVHPRDNVAIIVNPEGLPAGTRICRRTESRASAFRKRTRWRCRTLIPGTPSGATARPLDWRPSPHRPGFVGARGCYRFAAAAGAGRTAAGHRDPGAATGAGRLHVRWLSQRRWQRGNEEHPWHHHHRAVRRAHGGVCGAANQDRDSSAISRM